MSCVFMNLTIGTPTIGPEMRLRTLAAPPSRLLRWSPLRQWLPHAPRLWEGGNCKSHIVIPSERDPSLRGERESRDLAFLCAAACKNLAAPPSFGRVGTANLTLSSRASATRACEASASRGTLRFSALLAAKIWLPHPPCFWEGGNCKSHIVVSERDPSLRGECESRDLAFVCPA